MSSTEPRPPRTTAWPRLPPEHLGLGLLLALTTAIYGFGLGRGFVSEDFIILRRLSEAGFFETARAQLTGPWLDVTFFRFYRPIGTFVLQLEWLLFGVRPFGYLLVHLAAHGLAVCLVFRLVLGLVGQRGIALVASLPFALYPLGPNTVLFIASFATLFSTLACLGACLFFLRWRAAGAQASAPRAKGNSRRAVLGSLGLAALALGSYEGAVVLPATLLALDALMPRATTRRVATRMLFHLAAWGLLAIYFLLRRMALGTVVGGYPDIAAIFSVGRLHELASRMQIDLSRLLLPTWGGAHPDLVAGLLDLTVILVSVLAIVRWRAPAARLWWLGLAWIWLSQLPFGVVGVVPANGRYWYLPSIGIALWTAALLAAPKAPRRWLGGGLVTVFVLGYGTLLAISVHGHAEAGAAADRYRQALAAYARARAQPSIAPTFVHGEPDFVRQARGPFAGVPLAQVFHWGLADALMPPFEGTDWRIYPLPRFSASDLGPVFDAAGVSDPPVAYIDQAWRALVESPAPIPALHLTRGPDSDFRYQAAGVPEGCRLRAVIVARGHPDLSPWSTPRADGRSAGRLPADTVQTMLRLYQGPVYWWLEARDDGGGIRAQSGLFTLER